MMIVIVVVVVAVVVVAVVDTYFCSRNFQWKTFSFCFLAIISHGIVCQKTHRKKN